MFTAECVQVCQSQSSQSRRNATCKSGSCSHWMAQKSNPPEGTFCCWLNWKVLSSPTVGASTSTSSWNKEQHIKWNSCLTHFFASNWHHNSMVTVTNPYTPTNGQEEMLKWSFAKLIGFQFSHLPLWSITTNFCANSYYITTEWLHKF